MEELSFDKKMDFVPDDIMNCLTMEKPYIGVDPKSILTRNKKKVIINKDNTSKLSNIFDITTIRKDEIEKLNVVDTMPITASIIPHQYWIRKEDLVRFIEYTDRELETVVESDKILIVFPTELPNSRHEVKYLEETLRRMLDDCQKPDINFSNFRMKSSDDIYSIEEYVVRQEEVYNVILHELGRQVLTSSLAGGRTILELREKYSELVKKIPEELMRLKEEVKEQVVKDSKLLSKIENFQAGIVYLTDHLKEVKDKDVMITKSAESLQKELEAALYDSARSKELLNEYHVLYDLQRQRLDKQMSSINIEKEEWSSLAFALSLKISDESLLNTTRRLRLITKKLIQLSQHFAIFVSDCDTVITTKIQDLSDQFLKILTKLHTSTKKLINNFFDLFHFLRTKFESFAKKEVVSSKDQIKEVLNQVMSLNGFLVDGVMRKFLQEISSENLSNYETEVKSMNLLIEKMKSLLNELSGRSGFQTDEESFVDGYENLFQNIDEWSKMISSKIKIIANFKNFFLDFQSKVYTIESEIKCIIPVEFNVEQDDKNTAVANVILLIEELYIETFESHEIVGLEKNEDFTKFTDFYNEIQMSINAFSTKIDGFDAQVMENINSHQFKITHWIVDILFLLSNMSELEDLDTKYKNICATFEELIIFNGNLYEYVTRWTMKLIESSESVQSPRQLEMEEYKDENNQWNDVAEILIRNIGDKIEQELLKRRKESQNIKKNIDLDNVDELIEQIKSKPTTDKSIYLSIKSVQNLQSELNETEKRITEATENKNNLSETLQETIEKINEYQSKLEQLTTEYREFTKI